jgi:hypothetical protein
LKKKKMGRPKSKNPKGKISVSLGSEALKLVDRVAAKFTGGERSPALELIVKDWGNKNGK